MEYAIVTPHGKVLFQTCSRHNAVRLQALFRGTACRFVGGAYRPIKP